MIKKFFAFLLVLTIALSVAACSDGNDNKIEISFEDVVVGSSLAENESVSVGAETGDSSIEAEEEKFDVESVEDLKTIPVLYVRNFAELDSFENETTGATTAPLSNVSITGKCLKSGDKGYMLNVSESGMAIGNSYHEAFFDGVSVSYRDGKFDSFTAAALKDYVSEYGIYPFGAFIEGYTVTERTILSVGLAKKEGENLTYNVSLDPSTACDRNKVQMKRTGNLSGYPEFESVDIELTMKNDLTPVKVVVTAKYKVKMVITVTCTQSLTVTYKSVNESVDLPRE